MVLSELVEYVVFCGLSVLQRELYKKFAKSSVVKQLLNTDTSPGTAASLGCITALKKLCNHPQLVWEMIKDGSASIPDAVRAAFPKDFAKTAYAAEYAGTLESHRRHYDCSGGRR